jgi:hypothetical protein
MPQSSSSIEVRPSPRLPLGLLVGALRGHIVRTELQDRCLAPRHVTRDQEVEVLDVVSRTYSASPVSFRSLNHESLLADNAQIDVNDCVQRIGDRSEPAYREQKTMI